MPGPETLCPAPNARQTRIGVGAPTYCTSNNKVNGLSIDGSRPASGRTWSPEAGRLPMNREPTKRRYFEYSSTTSCSWAAIGMLVRAGFSSTRPLNVSLSTAIQDSGAPRDA